MQRRLPTRWATAFVIAALVAAHLAVPPRAIAGRCCYAMCRSFTGASAGVDVRCQDEDTDCPRTIGACMVWAQQNVLVGCAKARECPAGLHEKGDAEALLARLASDDQLTVVHPLTVDLSSGVTITFEQSP